MVCIKIEHSSNKFLKKTLFFLFCLSSSKSCPAEKPGPSEEIIITFILVCAETSPRAFVRFFINCKDNGLCFSPLVNSILTMFSVSFLIEKKLSIF